MASAENLSWDKRNNTVDLTINKVDKDNKAYLVDKRLLDFLLARVDVVTLNEMKADIKTRIDVAKSKAEIIKAMDDYVYLDKVLQLTTVKEEQETKYRSEDIVNQTTGM